MKKFSKILSLVLSIILALSVLAGCGKTNENKGGQSNTTKTTEKPKGKIVVWGWDFIKKSTDANMQQFKIEYPDIEVDMQAMQTGDVYKKLLLGISSGGEGLPDVAAVETSNLAQMVCTDGLMDLTDKVKPYINKMNKFKWADAKKDGKIYAMPWDSGPVALYYRRDIFENAGLPSTPEKVENLLKTWDDYYNVAKTIKQKTGVAMFSESKEKNSGRTFEKLMWQQGQFYFDKKGEPILDSPTAVKTMEYVGKFVKEGLTDNTQEWTQAWYDSMNKGKVATIIGAVWMGGFLKGWIAPDTKGKWGVVPLPTWPGSKSRTCNDGGSNLVITNSSKNKDAAWAYVEFMLTRKDSQINMSKATDVFPSLEDTYSDPYFDESDEYFGGQKFRKLFYELAKEIPEVEYTKNYSQANESYVNAYAKYILNNESASKVLKEANDEIKSKINQ